MGLLTKEPDICHGITGNAMTLEVRQREHFLCFATPERIDQDIADGIFEKSSDEFGMLWGEAGRARVWMRSGTGVRRNLCSTAMCRRNILTYVHLEPSSCGLMVRLKFSST